MYQAFLSYITINSHWDKLQHQLISVSESRMKQTIIGLLLLAALFYTAWSWPYFSYSAQDEWPGVCFKGNMGYQSPIDIDTPKKAWDRGLICFLIYIEHHLQKIIYLYIIVVCTY